MERKLSVEGRVHDVAASEPEPGRLRLTVDGAALEVRVLGTDGQRHLVETERGLEELFTVRQGGATWVWHRGRARRVEPVTPARAPRAPDPQAGAGTEVTAALPKGAVTTHMPAVVIAVLAEVGQLVQAGQGLVVVSAMKTETQLVAPLAGRVTTVATRTGAHVRPGELLVQVSGDATGAAPGEGGRDGG